VKLTLTLEDLQFIEEALQTTPWVGKRAKHLLESYGEDVADVASDIGMRIRNVLLEAKATPYGKPLPSAQLHSLRELEIVRMLLAHIAENVRHDFRSSRAPPGQLNTFLDGRLPRIEILGKRLEDAACDIKRRIGVEFELPENK
jgi:hypothetical protein